jgi:hypothetical protein
MPPQAMVAGHVASGSGNTSHLAGLLPQWICQFDSQMVHVFITVAQVVLFAKKSQFRE